MFFAEVIESAINKTTVEVTFSHELDKATAENFTIEGGKVNSASVSENKKTVTLDVSGLDYDTDYTLVATDLVYKGEASGTLSAKFSTPAVTDLWDLQVIPGKGSIEANGTDNTTVTFQLVDKVTGEVDTNANDLVLDLNTTHGALAQKRATIQNGKATVVLRSEFNAKGVTAKIDAQIIEASGDYKDLIGEVVGTANVQFTAPGSSEVDAVYLTAANTNEADRVTLTFDKAVSVADFVETDVNGQLTGVLRTDNTVTVTQNGGTKTPDVAGFLPGPTKNTLVAVLKIADADDAQANEVLTDNSDVKVAVTMQNSAGQATDSNQEFKFTDARVPQVTSVNPVGLNKLTVKFSEPIAKADFLIDGFYNLEDDHFSVEYGKFEFDTKSKNFVDNRNLVTLTLDEVNYEESGEDTLAGYFSAGKHALQVSKIHDFAALSDDNNIGSTQNLEFNIVANSDLAVSTVKVDSPNQYRITFDKDAKLDDTKVELQVYDTDAKEWVAADNGKGDLKAKPTISVNKIKGDTAIEQYKVEVEEAWTTLYQTATTNNNYYNDKYRLVIKKDGLKTNVNGKTNTSDIELPLNFAGSAMNTPDTTSPVISKVEATDIAGRYVVTMSEPVQDVDSDGKLAKEVEFIGKDKDGKVRTFKGEADGYTEDGLDNKFYVDTDINSTNAAPGATEYDLIKDLVLKGGSENWTLVLKDVTDDIGNKAATVTKDFLIKSKELVSKFEVKKNTTDPVTYAVVGSKDGKETIEITFTENVGLTGVGSAIDTANFQLNGADLPTGTSIALKGSNAADTIVITVKDGTLKEGSNVITLGKNLVSKEGKELTGAYAFTFNVDPVAASSDDASVTEIKVDGVQATVDPTNAEVYNVELPSGTDLTALTAADVVATATDSEATVATATTADNGTTWTVEVEAEDGTKVTYTINVTVATAPSDDASVTEVKVDGVQATVDPTNAEVYNVELPSGTDLTALTAADVVATATDSEATVATATTADNGTTWIVEVEAEDGTKVTYTINITVAP
ncbi:hypothetical protein [Sporosarcina aquimarina]|uniref:hypothetical protein n=1 Tax=Sporosarcina aquimarina TaxID=114975 RepID=UPI001C8E6454|nr:hypothetical protein [Sporosarcina aquimarina]MBY0221668.1 hypothetical protein [Sporosarcina aquimarina]